MFAAPISVSEAELRAAKGAGWRPVDLYWEGLQEHAQACYASGDLHAAARAWRKCARLARWRLARSDPRYAASLANAGFAARLLGRESEARRLYAEAARRWAGVPEWIDRMAIRARARSSLFHLRLEAVHRETYRENVRARLKAFASEAGAVIAAEAAGEASPHPTHARWKGEKPPVYDDARKVLAACLLLATRSDAARSELRASPTEG